MSEKIVIATRESPLALWQAEHVKSRLEAAHPGIEVSLLGMTSRGDQLLDKPLFKVGEIIAFTPEVSESNIQAPTFSTLYISAGRQQKVSKGDVLGFVCKIGELDMKHVGLIEIKDTSSYVAVHTPLAEHVITKCDGQRLKKGKVRVDFA